MGHDHSHQAPPLKNLNRAFFIGIVINLGFTIIEFVYGTMYNSLALVSDAGHNLSDVASLILSLLGMKLAQKVETYTYTYGFKKASLLASLANAILLIIVVIGILKSALTRFTDIPEIEGMVIVWIASIGVLINTVSAFLFYQHQKHDINIKGAFLHLMIDALVSVGVVISGLIIHYTGLNVIDPIISIVIVIIIIITTRSLLIESLRLVMDAVPKSIDFKEVEKSILKTNGVKEVHHIHIWALSSSINALTAHISITKDEIKNWNKIKDKIKHNLEYQNIKHVTLELDFENEDCKNIKCNNAID